jgi:site-specific recombinase XerD
LPQGCKCLSRLRFFRALCPPEKNSGSVGHKLTVLAQFYRALVLRGLRPDNPADGIHAPRERRALEDMHALDETALRALIAALPWGPSATERRDRILVLLMALHGLRTVECERASAQDLRRGPDGLALLVRGKGQDRLLWLRPDLGAELEGYLASRPKPIADSLGIPLFPAAGNRAGGKRLSRRGIRKLVDRSLAASGAKRPGLSGHALRHTAATLAYRHTRDLRAVQAMLGHASPHSTSRYARLVDGALNSPAAAVPIALRAALRP